MTIKKLTFEAPPSLAIAEAATTPNPGIAGVSVWSTTLGKRVYWDGTKWTAGAAVGATVPGGNTAQIQYNNAGAFSGASNLEIDSGDLVIVANAAPVTPVAGKVKLFGKVLGNTRIMAAAVGPSGMDYTLQPSMWRQKISRWNAPGGVATVPGVDGFGAMTVVGTATARTVATTNLLTRMRRLGYVSAAAAPSQASVRSATQFTAGTGVAIQGGGFFVSFRFAAVDPAAVAGARMFVGMENALATNVEMNARTNVFGIAQLSTDTTQLYLVYGGSAAQTAVALGTGFPIYNGAVGITTGVPYDFMIWCPPSTNGVFSWQLDRLDTGTTTGGTVTPATPGTQTPANTTLLAATVYRVNNATALSVGIDTSNIYVETDY